MQKIIIGREFPDEVTSLVKNAKHSIQILMFDWRWYPTDPGSRIQKFNNEVVKASHRGVNVTVLLNNNLISSFFRDLKISFRKVNTTRTMHVKMIIVDGQYLLLGSHNLSKNAFELNHEVSILTDDSDSIIKCNNYFETLCLL